MRRSFFTGPARLIIGCAVFVLLVGAPALRAGPAKSGLQAAFEHPPEAAHPWVFWYWMNAAVSRKGIKADLEAMKENGIGGAYLMPIEGPDKPPLITPPVVQLSPEWWAIVKYAFEEADKLGIKLAMHDCDGFAVAGGPWITPAMSMQKVVWSEIQVKGGQVIDQVLPQPPTKENYYRDIAIYAFPSLPGAGIDTDRIQPTVTTSVPGIDASYLAKAGNGKPFISKQPCWIQYAFKEPFTCRTIHIRAGDNYEARRFTIEASDDGEHFHEVTQLIPPRAGWQDNDADLTDSIVPTTARYFRFVYNPAGSEPGSEDLDSAKWRPRLKVRQIELMSAPRINQVAGKAGVVWRISRKTTKAEVPDSACVPMDRIINLTDKVGKDGHLHWKVPAGNWTILRMGHTSTGHMNEPAGGGKGLECDKFNPAAARIQFNHWFGAAIKHVGPELAGRVLKVFHVDSWECGSQNWSPVFRAEFKRRRGYDPLPYLPVMAGIPVQSADVSERFLHDVRRTIAELVTDNFFGTMAKLAHEHGCVFSSEAVAPTFTSDDIAHFSKVDLPMGEFWLRSPTHDKPNDILDAISGGHLYGKQIIQSEAFTELVNEWDEYPGMLKTLADRHFALGINRFVFHVFAENPWLDRKPGITLSHVGLYFQRDQTWWKPARAWVTYVERCQALLQIGRPVTDVAVFNGEEVPRRAVLPDRLLPTLPGLYGPDVANREAARLRNKGEPLTESPKGVIHSANITDAGDWIDPLHGYAYDTINRDALLRLATVRKGRVVLPDGASYGVLVVPGARRMNPNADEMSVAVANKLLGLVREGATVIVGVRPDRTPGLSNFPDADRKVERAISALWAGEAAARAAGRSEWRCGRGRVILAPYLQTSFKPLGLDPDFIATNPLGNRAVKIAWTHRRSGKSDIYFVSNQEHDARTISVSLRVTGKVPELWNPVTGGMRVAGSWQTVEGRTDLPVRLAANGSVFIVLRRVSTQTHNESSLNWRNLQTVDTLTGAWTVSFNPGSGGPAAPVTFPSLIDWTKRSEPGIRYYSGTAVYEKTFDWSPGKASSRRVWLDLGKVDDIASVTVNGIPCGVAWTPPMRVEITRALHPGKNTLRVEVTNTWANRLIRDHHLPKAQRLTWTTAPYRLDDEALLPAGLLGPVRLLQP